MEKTVLNNKRVFDVIKDGLEDTALIATYVETLLKEINAQKDFENLSMLIYQLKSLELKINGINSVIAKYEMSEKNENIIPS